MFITFKEYFYNFKSNEYAESRLRVGYPRRLCWQKKLSAGRFARKFCKAYRAAKAIRTKTFVGPRVLPGIDFSDHLNYWKFGFSALMITDTAFYRNKNYHGKSDTVETLDIYRMTKVIDGIYEALTRL